MKTYRLFLFCFFAILLTPLESDAQRDVYNWQITPYAGFLTVDNDIRFPKNADMYAYGLRLERRLGNDFTLGLHFSQLDLGDAAQNNISGGFLSLGYHWDNGYLLSQRSFLSVFHRLEIGYADRYSSFESINAKSADFAVGFENGLKFRLGDRISLDLALEIFSSKSQLTSGDIAKNIRYNVWKAGITYHFGSRKSNYVAPVFVPRTGIPSHLDKIKPQEDNIWIVNDSVYNDRIKIESVVHTKPDYKKASQLSLADSLLIFMHFDSLYQRRQVKDTLISYTDSTAMDSLIVVADSIVVDTASIDSIPIQEYDSLRTSSDSIMSPADSSQYLLRTSGDSIVSPVDSSQYFLRTSGDSIISPVDSTQYIIKTSRDSVISPADSTLYIIKTSRDSIVSPADSTQYILKTSRDSIASPADSIQYILKSSDSLAPIDSTTKILGTSESIVLPIDSTQNVDAGTVIISADSLKPDTVPVLKRGSVDSPAIVSPAVSDTVVILKTDTVYMEKPKPENFDQKSDTSGQTNIIDNGQGRVDTLYIVKDAEDALPPAYAENGETGKKDNAAKSSKDQDNDLIKTQNDLTKAEDDKIQSLEDEIDRLKKKNKRNNAGKVVAAGATGAALGAVVAKDKSEKDTVYVVTTDQTTRINSLQHELDSLNQIYGESDTLTVEYSPSSVNPPIGMYFSQDDSTSALLPDSAYALQADSLALIRDSLSTMEDDIRNKTLDETRVDGLDVSDTTVLPVVVDVNDTSAAEPEVSAEEPKDSEPETADKSGSLPDLMGEYPVSCNFGLNKTSLDKEELEKLDVVVDDLKNGENRKAMLTGHTDKSGNADYNLQLSKKRANSVREYLVSKGIAANRIEINAGGVLGSAEKYSPNARRVEVKVQETK